VYLIGNVVRGFGRGSRELGIPTANFDPNSVLNFNNQLKDGIYYGFAQIVKRLETNGN
jgi:PREDICTED: similar to riboflavin kinase